jgi:hypothetical protein
MSTAPRLEFRLDPRAGAAFREFARRAGPQMVETFTKKLAFDATRLTVRALNSTGRVSSGRYRAAWATVAELATGRAAGSKVVGPSDEDKATPVARGAGGKFLARRIRNPAQPGDAVATTTGAGMTRTITLTNGVPYGPAVEFGTAETPAGLHLTRAVAATRKTAEKALGAMLRRAWRR